jgi:hypothetical protein
MTTAQIIAGIAAVWRANATLLNYPIRSTRIPASSVNAEDSTFPYALIEAQQTSRSFHSGKNSLGGYELFLTVYCGENRATADTISNLLKTLFDNNIALATFNSGANSVTGETGGYLLSILPNLDNAGMDNDDYYGVDCIVLSEGWRLVVNETLNPVSNQPQPIG